MKRIAIAGLAIALVALAFIGGGIGLAAAQDEDAPVQSFLGRVAEKLGIGEDELSSAIAEVEGEIVDEKVAEGLLTPEQGENLKERIEENGLLGPRALHGMRGVARYHEGRLLHDSAATVLEGAGLIRADMKPKPLYERLLERVHGEWSTDLQASADRAGQVRARCTFGGYRVEATSAKGAPLVGAFDLCRKGPRAMEVKLLPV